MIFFCSIYGIKCELKSCSRYTNFPDGFSSTYHLSLFGNLLQPDTNYTVSKPGLYIYSLSQFISKYIRHIFFLIHCVSFRCLSGEECKDVTLENCDHEEPMMSLSAASAFECEQYCKIQDDCFFFKYSEGNCVCELFEFEYRVGCLDTSGPLVKICT